MSAPPIVRDDLPAWMSPSGWTVVGKSRARQHTGFWLPEIGVCLDGGVASSRWRARTILVTHAHFDHAGALPSMLRVDGATPMVLAPKQVIERVQQYAAASWLMKVPGGQEISPLPPLATTAAAAAVSAAADSKRPLPIPSPKAVWVPVEAGMTVALDAGTYLDQVGVERTNYGWVVDAKAAGPRKTLTAHVVQCHHTTPAVGYVICETRTRLAPEHAHLSGKEIADLRKAGTAVTCSVEVPRLAFLCDTTARVLEEPAVAGLVASCATVMIECTFLDDNMVSEAASRGHICWCEIEAFVEAHPSTTFVLFHFSLRYSDDNILDFFVQRQCEGGGHALSNVVLWLDRGPTRVATA